MQSNVRYASGYRLTKELIERALPNVPVVRVLTEKYFDTLPVVHVSHIGGQVGDIERADRMLVTVYSPAPTGDDSVAAAELSADIMAALDGGPHDTASGYVDEVITEVPPTLKLTDDRVDEATATYVLVHRPLPT